MSDDAPGWMPDPSGAHDHRYWDGSQWTEHVSDGGVAAVDPYVAPAPAPEAPPAPEEPPAVAPEPTAEAVAPPPAPVEPDATVVGPAAGAGSDPTASWPTAPTAPAPPPPYVPTGPVVEGGGPGGSKRGLLIGAGILAAVVVAVIAFTAFGGDDETNVRAQLASKLREEESSLTASQAQCVADLIVDEAGENAFKDTDWDSADPPPEFIGAMVAVGLSRLADECELAPNTFGGSDNGETPSTDGGSGEEGSYGSDPDLDALYDDCASGDYQACDDLFFQSPSDSEYEQFGDTCGDRNEPSGTCVALYGEGSSGGGITDAGALPDNFEEIIADTYVTTFGLSRDKAECLAEKIGSAIRDGLLDEEEAFSEVFDYLSDCDITMEEISGQ